MPMIWHVGCELCNWWDDSAANREAAIAAGHEHSDERHADEWRFRVQGRRVAHEPAARL